MLAQWKVICLFVLITEQLSKYEGKCCLVVVVAAAVADSAAGILNLGWE